jgi:hypothetical protein
LIGSGVDRRQCGANLAECARPDGGALRRQMAGQVEIHIEATQVALLEPVDLVDLLSRIPSR